MPSTYWARQAALASDGLEGNHPVHCRHTIARPTCLPPAAGPVSVHTAHGVQHLDRCAHLAPRTTLRMPSPLLRQPCPAAAAVSAPGARAARGSPQERPFTGAAFKLAGSSRSAVLASLSLRAGAPGRASLSSAARAAPALRLRPRAALRRNRLLPTVAAEGTASGVAPANGAAAAVAITGVAVFSAAPYVHDFLEGACAARRCPAASRTD
jgi:hypothetical protein